MTRAQYHREKVLALREARERELQMIAAGRATADPRYVRDVIAWMWEQVMFRKMELCRNLPELSSQERRRLDTLLGLYV